MHSATIQRNLEHSFRRGARHRLGDRLERVSRVDDELFDVHVRRLGRNVEARGGDVLRLKGLLAVFGPAFRTPSGKFAPVF